MSSPASSPHLGRSENRADYQAAFLSRVHHLLQCAYQSLNAAEYKMAEEDDITGDLCKHMKHLTEIAPAERWMTRFSVHDQDPVNEVKSRRTDTPRKGKRRPRIDVRLVCKHQIPNRGYCIEAKRFYRSDSVSEYVGSEGIGAFIRGDYGNDDDFGGMLGYVQSKSVDHWLRKIERKLPVQSSLTRSEKGCVWEPVRFPRGPKRCLASRHDRESGRSIQLIHVMFSFHTHSAAQD